LAARSGISCAVVILAARHSKHRTRLRRRMGVSDSSCRLTPATGAACPGLSRAEPGHCARIPRVYPCSMPSPAHGDRLVAGVGRHPTKRAYQRHALLIASPLRHS
jgi:hypothetical protein